MCSSASRGFTMKRSSRRICLVRARLVVRVIVASPSGGGGGVVVLLLVLCLDLVRLFRFSLSNSTSAYTRCDRVTDAVIEPPGPSMKRVRGMRSEERRVGEGWRCRGGVR